MQLGNQQAAVLIPVVGRRLNNKHRLVTSKSWDVSLVVLYLHHLTLRVELPSVQPVLLSGHESVVFEQRTQLCVVTPLPSKEIKGQEPGLFPNPATKGFGRTRSLSGVIFGPGYTLVSVYVLHLLKYITVF